MNNLEILKGIKVVELASVLAGPSVGTFLAEMGATVIKVENPRTDGDTTRKWKTAGEDALSATSAYFASANWGKESIFLDLTDPHDHAKCLELIRDADILLENFKPGDAPKFSLDFEQLKSLNSRLIVGHIQGYSTDDRPAFDVVLQAESGFMSLNGNSPEGLKWPLPIVDILAAHQLKEGILLALLQRQTSGIGAFVSVSLFDAAVAALHNVAGNVLMGGADPVALGPLHPNICPYGEVITSKDSVNIVLAVGTDAQFIALCRALNLPDEIINKFSTNSLRLKSRSQLEKALKSAAAEIGFDELSRALIEGKVPFGTVKRVKEVLEQLPEQSFLKEEQNGVSTIRMRTGIFKITS